jgi:hypothetical protein
MPAHADSVQTTPIATPLDGVRAVLQVQPELVFSVLVGSRAKGTAHANSDWDIALQWAPGLGPVTDPHLA